MGQVKKYIKTQMQHTYNAPMGNPRSIITPNEYDVQLKFVDSITLAPGALPYANYVFNPNCPYDVDPAFGSTSTGGFAELAALFQFVRAVKYSYKMSLINNSNVPCQFTVINVNVTPPSAAYYGIAGNQFAQTKTAGASTFWRYIADFSGQHTVAQIVGSETPETADSFASLTNNVPTDKIWLGIGQTTIGVGSLAAFTIQIQITMWMRFYERKNLSS